MNAPLNHFLKNIYSQNGEDGLIEELLLRMQLPLSGGWCVEFGAWDGKHCSNTFALVQNNEWSAIFIEGDDSRFNDLLHTVQDHQKITPVLAFVDRFFGEPNCLDYLLAKTQIPKDFDLLSIDIDSYDLDIWESLEGYSAKIVVIEINSGILPGVIWRHSPTTPGNTFTATLNVGISKGYTLVCHTGNLIFVRNDYISKINLDKKYLLCPEGLFSYKEISKDPFKVRQSAFAQHLKGFLKNLISKM